VAITQAGKLHKIGRPLGRRSRISRDSWLRMGGQLPLRLRDQLAEDLDRWNFAKKHEGWGAVPVGTRK
jgi:hypothetical protein